VLSYVLLAQLLGVGFASAFSSGRGSDQHAICSLASADGSDERNSDYAHLHRMCCTAAFAEADLVVPEAFGFVAHFEQAPVIPSADFGARPSTAPPKLGRGPRPPPSDLA